MVDLKEIERKWQEKWRNSKIFEANPEKGRKKFFVTFPFPYMNGPLHIGHAFTATRVDVFARFKRMMGFNVLFPWAWHYTGESIPGVAKRIKEGDEKILRSIREIDGVAEDEVKKFVDPLYLANYYRNDSKKNLLKVGFSIDWRREFTTIDKIFSKFVEWQYLTLREKGYVVKGTHPVVYCPNCQSPTGDHDRLEGEGVSPVEFVLIKFKMGDVILPTATLRAETVYGVTNVWINPEKKYVEVKVNDERWIVSEECAEKLKYQEFGVDEIKEIDGRSLIGKKCVNPVTKDEVLILPANFVDPLVGTGVVMSVPSHAPYDWVALEELKKNRDMIKKYGLNEDLIKEIKPISLIRLEGWGEHPAKEICEKFGIKTQSDEKLKKVTEEIYKKEFHLGILKENTGKYVGKKVSEIKETLIKDFVEKNIAIRFYDLPEKVVCRCTTRCVVKIFKDQWFLKYSDEKWKSKVRECLSKMKIFPEEARNWFKETINWLENKACTRKSGLGTKLPWDKEWLVETLSDSTIYMAFYTISHLIKELGIPPESLTKEFFDYVFLGNGSPKEEIWRKMREEFTYWYPVDFRNSAKELIPNHLTFFLFHHVAIFPENFWPKTIGVNGMITIEGQKMSKSKGIFITFRQALEWYGADGLRLSLMNLAEGMDDVDFRRKDAEKLTRLIRNFYEFAIDCVKKNGVEEIGYMEKWLISRLYNHIKEVTRAYEETRFKTVIQHSFFELWNDVKWYLRRNGGKANKKILKEVVKDWILLLCPIIPHVCEELWEKIGMSPFASLQKWPEVEEKLVDKKVLELEDILKKSLEDVNQVIKLVGMKERLYLYVKTSDEFEYFKKAENFIKERFGLKEVIVYKWDDPKRYDPQNKASKAKYGKPGIYLE